jgi:hypothetical protein
MFLVSFVIYKITYLNGKIYVGRDLTNSANHWQRSARFHRKGFYKRAAERLHDTLRAYRLNDPEVGYNRWPKFRAH